MSAIELIVLSLATWRLTSMLSLEAGPFRLLERVRRVGLRIGVQALECFGCLSVWVGQALVWVFWWDQPLIEVVVLGLAVSGLAYVIERIVVWLDPSDIGDGLVVDQMADLDLYDAEGRMEEVVDE